MNPVFSELPNTIFDVMSGLARELEAVNLGQGFPDDPGPEDVRRKAAEAVVNGWNQYPPMMGLLELREAIAAHYLRFQGLVLDPASETMVTSGATEALAAAILAVVTPGDEVVLFQPMYDAYLPLVLRAGGRPRFVNLKPPQWTFAREDLEAVFSPRTKAVLFNNPLNPSATIVPDDQLLLLAEFCERYDSIAICDEVWEHVVFDDRRFTSMLAVEEMRKRAIKIGSAGKIFSLTGWKVGLVAAPAPIMKVLAKAHQFLTFTTPPNLQIAVSHGLAKDEAYFTQMRAGFQRSRDRFVSELASMGFSVMPSHGTYFANVDLSGFEGVDDVTFADRLVRQFGVASIPVSAFYKENPNRSTLRFCFAKKDSTLDDGLDRIRRAARDLGLRG